MDRVPPPVRQGQCGPYLLGGDPAFHACKIASGERVPAWCKDSWTLVETILKNWRRGFYQRAELAWPNEDGRASISNFKRSVAGTPGADTALDIPPDLFGPLPGRQPRVPPELTPQENADLWDMLHRQGTWAGPRPGSDEWKAEREKAASAAKETGFWNKLFR